MKRPLLIACFVVLLAAPMQAAEDRADTNVIFYRACHPYYMATESQGFWGKITSWQAWSNRWGWFVYGNPCRYIQ